MADTLTREQLLDELEYLATVEHALIVDYLIIHCALGADVLSDEHPATTAAGTALNMAMATMTALSLVNRALVKADRQPSLGRASHLVPEAGLPIPVGSFSPDQLPAFRERETSAAREVDRRWARVGAALTALGPEGEDIATELGAIPEHAPSVAALLEPLAMLAPPAFLRVSRLYPADEFERRALAVGDLYYQAIVASLRVFPTHPEWANLRGTARGLMFDLQAVMRVLVGRGVIPSFDRPVIV